MRIPYDAAVVIFTAGLGILIAEGSTSLTKYVGKTVFKSDPKVTKIILIINIIIWIIMIVLVGLDLTNNYYSLSYLVEAFLKW